MKKVLFFVFLILSAQLIAHPHLFIEYTAELVFSEQGLEGIQVTWELDEMFSWQVVTDYTSDGDFNISEEENKSIEQNAFRYLEESGYFAYLLNETEQFHVTEVKDFRAEGKNNKLLYHFFIPWKIPASTEKKNLKLIFDDETYFCAVIPKKKAISTNAPNNISVEVSALDQISFQLTFYREQL